MLRRFRERLTPEAAGIPVSCSSGRRAPGLRREELAERAGISTDYLKRLEQGRRHPSPSVVDALAKALSLVDDEQERLRSAAGYVAPARPGSRVPREITPPARHMLDRLTEVPVAVCDAAWTVLAGNARWNAYDCGARARRERDRNIAWRIFTEAPTDVFRAPARLAAFQASLVADLRAAQRRYGGDPELQALIADLHGTNGEFTRLWHLHGPADHHGDRMSVSQPDGGALELDRDTFMVAGDLRVVVFTTP
jgi:transcriptional regulator with XRE-family HTH domain